MSGNTSEMIQEFLEYLLHVRTLSGATVKSYGEDLKGFSRYLGEMGLSLDEVDDLTARGYVAVLTKNSAAKSSVNRQLSTLRSFYGYLVKHREYRTNPFTLIKSLKRGRKIPEFLFEHEMEGYVQGSGGGFPEVRDTALFELLYGTGCRIAELTAMNTGDLNFRDKTILVKGKGGKERLVFFGKSAENALKAYLPLKSARAADEDRDAQNALFINQRGRRLTPRGVFMIVKKRAEETGAVKNVSPHTFRHSFATHLINRGADIRVVQELLGHANLSTTQIYTHMGLARLKKIYDEAHPHGRRTKTRKVTDNEYEL